MGRGNWLKAMIDLDELNEDSLKGLSENFLRREVIIPLLKEIGIRGIEDVHGVKEHGIDVLFIHHDIFRRTKLFGIQCKKGDIVKTAKEKPASIITITNQIREAFKRSFAVPGDPKYPRYIDGYYVVASGIINSHASEYICDLRHEFPYIDIIDGHSLLRIITNRNWLRLDITEWAAQSFDLS